jgi:aryl-alcohol dehydrogenase-like predicted oxidoreductase
VNDVPIEESLRACDDLVKQGKIRHVGLSNETPWGVAEFLKHSKDADLTRVVSIQNPYNLLNRTFEVGLAEFAHREAVGLLAYSPLAMGVLSGKYRHGAMPIGSRLSLFTRFKRYSTDLANTTTESYLQIAEKFGLNPVQMALAFVTQQPFVSSNIIGATTLEQLQENIDSSRLTLNSDVLTAIEAVHRVQPNPCP